MKGNLSLSNYTRSHPSKQNAVDIFRDEWSSKFPENFEAQTTGLADLFEDQRIIWAENAGVSFRNKKILELGPLEAGHTWMMDQRGANEILAIEANQRAYLKCLIVKEIATISSAKFILGDYDNYLANSNENFDICLASGVLYHSTDPTRLLECICKCSQSIILWTHYYDQAAIEQHGPGLLSRFEEPVPIKYKNKEILQHPFIYCDEASEDTFCGGLEANSLWLEREGIESVLSMNGFGVVATSFEHPHHPNGPAFALIANKVRL